MAPFKTLDAPEICDDYFSNLLAWSEKNVVAIALRALRCASEDDLNRAKPNSNIPNTHPHAMTLCCLQQQQP